MAITLRDIAERTGVSPSVVSTVLSGRENGTFVSKTTRQRVLDMARQLNYVPVRSGRPRGSRRLRRQHTEQFIGVWSPAGASLNLMGVTELQAVVDTLPTAAQSASDDEDTFSLGLRLITQAELPRLDTLGLAGMIVMGDSPLPRSAAIASIPTVQIGEPEHSGRDAYTYFLDSFAAGRAIGDHLWSLGHRTLAFVAPASKPRVTRHRWQGLQSIWVERGAAHSACVPAPYDTDKLAAGSLREQADQAVRKLYLPASTAPSIPSPRPVPMPTAIVCFDEAVTAYVLQSLTRLGKSVPGDVSVATFGDSPDGAEAMSPPLTTIRLPLAQMCRAALDTLLARSGAEGAETSAPAAGEADAASHERKFAGELIVRESTAPPTES